MIAILDWGIGGLSVLKKLTQHRPDLDILYFSDSGFTPYGKLSPQDLEERLHRVFAFLIDQGAQTLVVACNAASTAVIDETSFHNKPLWNVILPIVRQGQQWHGRRIGVIGGLRTIDSHIYRDRLERDYSVQVFESIAQPLSALIEQGRITTKEVQADLELIMKPLQEVAIEVLILACTHYPALLPVLQQLYPDLICIDPADYLVEEIIRDLPLRSKDKVAGAIQYYTTGEPSKMIQAAQKAFQWEIQASSQMMYL